MKDSHELARLCTLDLGREITSDEVKTALLTGRMPSRLSAVEQGDMMATLVKEMGSADTGQNDEA